MKSKKLPNNHVLVIGSSGLDIVGRLEAPAEAGGSNAARVRPSFGGTSRNVAENLARLGLNVRLISAAGNDAFGDLLLEFTASAGVDVSACLRTNEFSTASYLAVLSSEGSLEFALDDMRIHSLITPEYIKKFTPLFETACMIFVDANLSADALDTVFELAKASNVRVCANTTAIHLSKRLTPHLNQLFMVTGNNNEAALLCDVPIQSGDADAALDAARTLIAAGVEYAVVTLAEHGVVYAASDTSGHVPAMNTNIFDPTGAGDAMTAAVIFGILYNMPIDEAVRLGVSAATLTLRSPGTVMADLSLEKLYDELVI
jgi:pseudouridine kinase